MTFTIRPVTVLFLFFAYVPFVVLMFTRFASLDRTIIFPFIITICFIYYMLLYFILSINNQLKDNFYCILI